MYLYNFRNKCVKNMDMSGIKIKYEYLYIVFSRCFTIKLLNL